MVVPILSICLCREDSRRLVKTYGRTVIGRMNAVRTARCVIARKGVGPLDVFVGETTPSSGLCEGAARRLPPCDDGSMTETVG